MAWVRAGQLSAETGSAVDSVGLAGGMSFEISSVQKFTGQYSYRHNHNTSGVGSRPTGMAGFSASGVRCNLMLRHNGVENSTILYGVMGMRVDGALLFVNRKFGTGEVGLCAGRVLNSSTHRIPVTVVSTALAEPNWWYSVGMVAYMAVQSGFVSLYVDGEQILHWEGEPQGNTQIYRSDESIPRTLIDAVYVGGRPSYWGIGSVIPGWNAYPYVDDFYVDVWEGEGAPVDKAPSLRRFMMAVPSAVGASSQWAPEGGSDNHAQVAQVPPDDDTTVVKALYPDLLDLYEFADVTLPSDHAVRAVIPMAYAKKSDSGLASTLKLVASDGAGIQESDEKALSISYGHVWDRMKHTSAEEQWTEGTVNAAQFGIRSSGEFEDDEE